MWFAQTTKSFVTNENSHHEHLDPLAATQRAQALASANNPLGLHLKSTKEIITLSGSVL